MATQETGCQRRQSAEAGQGTVHLATPAGIPMHPDRAGLARNHQPAVMVAGAVGSQAQNSQQDAGQVAGAQSQPQSGRSPGKKGRKWQPRKPGANGDSQRKRGPRERTSAGDPEPPPSDGEGSQDNRPSRGSNNQPERQNPRFGVKETRFRSREDRGDQGRRTSYVRGHEAPPYQPRPRADPQGPRRWDRDGYQAAQGPNIQNPRPPVQCGFCGRSGHVMRNCRSVSCFICGRKGHLSTDCRNRAGHLRESQPRRDSRAPAYTAVTGVEGTEPREKSGAPVQGPSRDGSEGRPEVMSEVVRAARALTEKLQTLTEPKFPTIFPY